MMMMRRRRRMGGVRMMMIGVVGMVRLTIMGSGDGAHGEDVTPHLDDGGGGGDAATRMVTAYAVACVGCRS
jgi:hypothetical protein